MNRKYFVHLLFCMKDCKVESQWAAFVPCKSDPFIDDFLTELLDWPEDLRLLYSPFIPLLYLTSGEETPPYRKSFLLLFAKYLSELAFVLCWVCFSNSGLPSICKAVRIMILEMYLNLGISLLFEFQIERTYLPYL